MDVGSLNNMRIGLGVTRLCINSENSKLDGIAYYTRNIKKQLTSLNLEIHLLKFGKKGSNKINELKVQPIQKFLPFIFLRMIFFNKKKSFKKIIDIFHSTDHLVPINIDVPVVATVMDTYPISNPQMTNGNILLRLVKNWIWIRTTKHADHVITISKFSKKEIMKYMKISASKISVIELGVDDFYFKKIQKSVFQEVSKRYKLPKKYFLFIGSLQPRKNIPFMIKAHEKFCSKLKKNIPLVVIANNVFNDDYARNLIQEIIIAQQRGQLIWLQLLDDKDKRAILQNAQALILPSTYEGFGLTILEGFASGVPVITSNIASMPEVSKNAAILVDPYRIETLTAALYNVYKNKKLRISLIKKGLARAKELTWKKTTLNTIAIYKKIIQKYDTRPSLL